MVLGHQILAFKVSVIQGALETSQARRELFVSKGRTGPEATLCLCLLMELVEEGEVGAEEAEEVKVVQIELEVQEVQSSSPL